MTHEMKVDADRIRRIIIEQSYRAGVGHIGSALSVADIIAVLYSSVLNVLAPEDRERDRFVLSKGHAALALYAALYLKGWISEEKLNSFSSENTDLGVHPERRVRGIDFCTGSLGQGMTYAVGAALATRLQGSPRRTFVLVSDAECNEGSLWEAVMFAAHWRLSGLVAIIDLNGQQALGYTHQVLNLSPQADKWRAFGWDVREVDGHDPAGMARLIAGLDVSAGPPHVLIAHTTFGKGVSFMQSQIPWHYLPLTEETYRLALEELEAAR